MFLREESLHLSICTMQLCSQVGRRLLKSALLSYRICISPLLGQTCRFHPSCSAYALEAVEKYGACKGIYLTSMRLAKCHPWHPGGCDPVC